MERRNSVFFFFFLLFCFSLALLSGSFLLGVFFTLLTRPFLSSHATPVLFVFSLLRESRFAEKKRWQEDHVGISAKEPPLGYVSCFSTRLYREKTGERYFFIKASITFCLLAKPETLVGECFPWPFTRYITQINRCYLAPSEGETSTTRPKNFSFAEPCVFPIPLPLNASRILIFFLPLNATLGLCLAFFSPLPLVTGEKAAGFFLSFCRHKKKTSGASRIGPLLRSGVFFWQRLCSSQKAVFFPCGIPTLFFRGPPFFVSSRLVTTQETFTFFVLSFRRSHQRFFSSGPLGGRSVLLGELFVGSHLQNEFNCFPAFLEFSPFKQIQPYKIHFIRKFFQIDFIKVLEEGKKSEK